MKSGIRDLRGHIYIENYSPEIAVGRAVKVAYIAVCLFADEPFERVEDYTKYMNDKFTQPELTSVKYLRKVDPEAYAYMIKGYCTQVVCREVFSCRLCMKITSFTRAKLMFHSFGLPLAEKYCHKRTCQSCQNCRCNDPGRIYAPILTTICNNINRY